MAHIEINRDGWTRLEGVCHFHSIEDIADMTGMPVEVVTAVLHGQRVPDSEFVAACLWNLPASFNQLFEVASAAA